MLFSSLRFSTLGLDANPSQHSRHAVACSLPSGLTPLHLSFMYLSPPGLTSITLQRFTSTNPHLMALLVRVGAHGLFMLWHACINL